MTGKNLMSFSAMSFTASSTVMSGGPCTKGSFFLEISSCAVGKGTNCSIDVNGVCMSKYLLTGWNLLLAFVSTV